MDELILTRYLYPEVDVKQSLLLALLDHNSKEALFWGYELYYTGYGDVYEYILNIYDNFYKSENPELEAKLFSKGIENECWIGTVILTLSSRNYQICDFLREYKGESCERRSYPPTKFRFIIAFKPSDLVNYKMELPIGKKHGRFYLPIVCKFPIRRECNTLFESTCNDFRKEFEHHWLYFAAKSPVWLYRIRDFGGSINEDTKEVDFPNDDFHDEFYDRWGIEPDEQPLDLKDKCIGNCQVQQLSMKEFCDKYGGIQKKLENTIILS
jgi:hypothetical protein